MRRSRRGRFARCTVHAEQGPPGAPHAVREGRAAGIGPERAAMRTAAD
ncbi:hypothetical protein E4N62_04810 [Streptomyces sp. MNU76]|nr:hypothetical protein [Streptomyces sp. MNU76]MCC9704633.1 hypothetical protein [Streptomyces sp. MNU76]